MSFRNQKIALLFMSLVLCSPVQANVFQKCMSAFEQVFHRVWVPYHLRRPVRTSEINLAEQLEKKILPYFHKYGREGILRTQGDIVLHYRVFPVTRSKKAIVISSGRGEILTKYLETIYNLTQKGYSVYILDQRGHGKSGGKTKDNPRKVHVEKFEDYVVDLKLFIDEVVLVDSHAEVVLLGHSMGGLIAALYASHYPDRIDKLILSAPMFGIDMGKIPPGLVKMFAGIARRVGFGRYYAPGQKDPPEDASEVPGWTKRRQIMEEMQTHPLIPAGEVVMGGSTLGWVVEAMAASRKGLQRASKIHQPVLLLQAEREDVVLNGAQDSFAEKVDDCTKVVLENASHGILMETDSVRDEAFKAIFSFLEK